MGQRVWTMPWIRCEPVTPSKGLFLWNGVFSVIVNGLFFIFCLFKKQTKFVALKNTVLLRADLSCWRLQLRHRCCQFIYFCKKMGQPRPLLSFIFGLLQTNIITIFTTNICEKMSIQYTVSGFEPTTFGTWVSSLNHLTRAPALANLSDSWPF